MAGFVPGRDRVTMEAFTPEESQRKQALESAERQAILDKEELIALERAQVGAAAPPRKPRLLDRLLRRG